MDGKVERKLLTLEPEARGARLLALPLDLPELRRVVDWPRY